MCFCFEDTVFSNVETLSDIQTDGFYRISDPYGTIYAELLPEGTEKAFQQQYPECILFTGHNGLRFAAHDLTCDKQ